MNSSRSAWGEALRIDAPQAIARVRQIVGRLARAVTLEVRARRDEIGGVRAAGHGARLISGGNRRLKLTLIVEKTRLRERILSRPHHGDRHEQRG